MAETTATESGQSTGAWVTPDVSYVEPLRNFCAFCGRPIARQYWKAAPAGESLSFCDPDHAKLYTSYWLATYGANAKGDGKATG
jgi:hypothetical protein